MDRFPGEHVGRAMSISLVQASTARIGAARLEGDANRKQTVHVSLFTPWLQAHPSEDDTMTTFRGLRGVAGDDRAMLSFPKQI